MTHKITQKTAEKTTYQLSTSKQTLTLKNDSFEQITNSINLSVDNPKIKNQISIF